MSLCRGNFTGIEETTVVLAIDGIPDDSANQASQP